MVFNKKRNSLTVNMCCYLSIKFFLLFFIYPAARWYMNWLSIVRIPRLFVQTQPQQITYMYTVQA